MLKTAFGINIACFYGAADIAFSVKMNLDILTKI